MAMNPLTELQQSSCRHGNGGRVDAVLRGGAKVVVKTGSHGTEGVAGVRCGMLGCLAHSTASSTRTSTSTSASSTRTSSSPVIC